MFLHWLRLISVDTSVLLFWMRNEVQLCGFGIFPGKEEGQLLSSVLLRQMLF